MTSSDIPQVDNLDDLRGQTFVSTPSVLMDFAVRFKSGSLMLGLYPQCTAAVTIEGNKIFLLWNISPSPSAVDALECQHLHAHQRRNQ